MVTILSKAFFAHVVFRFTAISSLMYSDVNRDVKPFVMYCLTLFNIKFALNQSWDLYQKGYSYCNT